MNRSLKISALTVTGLIISFIFVVNNFPGFCYSFEKYCTNLLSNYLLISVFFWSIPTFILTAICCFLREKIFFTWLKFCSWWIPSSAFLIFITPHDGGNLLLPDGKQMVFFLLLILFFIISLTIIVVKQLQYWREDKSV